MNNIYKMYIFKYPPFGVKGDVLTHGLQKPEYEKSFAV